MSGLAKEMSARRGPRGSRGVVRAQVLAAARTVFASAGWKGTTLRDVAEAAGVDPRTVAYYFADRDQLLEAAMQPSAEFLSDVGEVNGVPLAERGRALVVAALRTWSRPENSDLLALIMAVGQQHPAGLATFDEMHRTRFIDVIARGLSGPDAMLRAGLAAGEIVSISVARFVWRLEPLASLVEGSFVAVTAPTVQHYLSGDLGRAQP